MGSLAITVAPDLDRGVICIALSGRLDLATAPEVRQTLAKCYVQAPEAVIVDISRLSVAHPSQLAVFPSSQRATPSPVPLLLCAPPEPLVPLLRGRVVGGLPVYDSRERAMAAALARGRGLDNRRCLRLPAVPDAPARARDLVDEACNAWRIEETAAAAQLIASELVTNAVRHAGTDVELAVALRDGYLHLSVHDGDPQPPRPAPQRTDPEEPVAEDGRGLHLVDVYSTAWGSVPTVDGKIVWATLPARPRISGWPEG